MNKKLACITICMILLGCTICKAQIIKGSILDLNNSPVPYATVILQTTDSIYLNSTYTDSIGLFQLSIDSSEYRLIVQHLMYETYEQTYSNKNDITIQLIEKENALNEVIIKGERPVVKLIDGRMTYDMSLLLSGTTVSNAYESILRLPGVQELNGVLALAGASNLTIIINGQKTSMPVENLVAALKMYPSERIQSAEVMYSAPPQYHVRGAVINLVLKGSDDAQTLQGQVNMTYTQKKFANHTEGFSIFIPNSKFNTDINYAFDREHQSNGVDIYSNHILSGNSNYIEQLNRGERKSNTHHIRIGLDYNLTEKQDLSMVYTSQIASKIRNSEESVGTFSFSDNYKTNDVPIQMHNALLSYSSSGGLKIGTEYTYYSSQTNQHFVEKMIGNESEFMAVAKQEVNRYRVFADKSHLLASEWKLNYGTQYMYASDNSSQVYSSFFDNDLIDMNMKNRLTENTINAYAGIEKQIGNKLSIKASVTGEYYRLADFEEWTVFPAFNMTYIHSPSNIMQFSFSSDKVYPAYWEMLGAVSFLNGYVELHGNPLLKPYRSYSGQLSYILKNKYILTAFYNYMDKYSMQLPYQAQDRLALIYQTLNFDYKQTAGLNFIIPFKVGEILETRLSLMGFYDKMKSSHFHDISFIKDNVAFFTQLNNLINISSKHNIKMEINGAFISKNIQGPAELTSLWNFDIGFKWTFLNERAELKLKGTDLFNSWTPDMKVKYKTQDLKMNIIPDGRALSLSFIFKFGGYDKAHDKLDSSRFGTK